MISLPLIAPETVHRARLANGLTVLIRRDDSAPVVAIVTHVKAGYFDETDDVVGIAHVLEHMFFKGTPSRGVGEISKQTKAAGGYLNAGTIYDHTSYYTVLPSSGFLSGLEIQADAYANSSIDADELSKELEVIIQEAKRKADNPAAVAIESTYELLHDRHRMRRWRIGREAGLRTLTREMMLRFYRGFYRPGNTILSIVGDVEPEDALRRATELYGPLPDQPLTRDRGPNEAEHTGFRYREMAGDITQSQLVLAWRTPETMHPDSPLLDLGAMVLGTGRASRLYRAVRERQLAASVSAHNYTPTELGVFMVHAETPPATTLDAGRNIWEQVRDVRDAGVGQDELWRVRRITEAQWIRRLETMEGQATHLADWEALGDWTLGDRYLESLLTASPERVSDALRRYLAPARAAALVYRPTSAAEVATDPEQMLSRLSHARPLPLPTLPPHEPVPPPAAAAAPVLERIEGRVYVYRTTTDIPILVRRKPGALVHIAVQALGGASREPTGRAGLTSLLARAAVKGTERRSAERIAEEAEMLGGSVAPQAGSETVGWAISVPAAHASAAMDLLADVVQRPTFPDEAVATERTVALADLALLRDDMYRYPMRLLTQAAFAGHPYGTPASGTEETIPAIDAGALRAWHGMAVRNAPMVIAIVGDVSPDDVAALAARQFTSLHAADAAPLATPHWPAEPIVRAEDREKAQTAMALGFPAPSRLDEDRFAASLIAGVASGLGGRFFDELRDRRSLAYTVHAHTAERRLAGMFVSYIATSPEKEEVARSGLLAEFEKLRDAPVQPDELQQAKRYAVGTHAIRQQSGGAVLAEMVDAWLLGTGLAELDEYDRRVLAVSAREMHEVARRYFDDARLVEGVVRGTGKVV